MKPEGLFDLKMSNNLELQHLKVDFTHTWAETMEEEEDEEEVRQAATQSGLIINLQHLLLQF